jgi:class 3 adenylate cyclase
MPPLGQAERARLPDSAFAYIDSRGRRRLPIHDEAHVRNALARFGQVAFEDDEARERARSRLLKAAKKYGIVPVGFISGQLISERELARRRAALPVDLPSGLLTMLMTDIEGSTALVQQLGDRYRGLLTDVRAILRDTALGIGGHVVEARADEFFAVFDDPGTAIGTAVAIQRELRTRSWLDDLVVRIRVGIHSGTPTLADGNYLGMPVHATARICASAHGGQVLVSGDTREAVRLARPDGIRFRNLGAFRLRGIPDAMPLFQVMARGLMSRFPPLRSAP